MKNPVDYPIHEVLRNRWSPYAIDAQRNVSKEDLISLFEAARWTMSSYNAQPWRYIVGVRGQNDEVWQQVYEVLLEGNQPWAKNAPVLALGLVEHNFEYNGKPNKAAVHDLGAASAALTFEATARGMVVHQMIGINPEKARQTFKLGDSVEPFTGLAIGYQGSSGSLPKDFASRDERKRKRERKLLDEIILFGSL